MEFLRQNGIDDPGYFREIDYQEVLNAQEIFGDELEMFARKETQKDVSSIRSCVRKLNDQLCRCSFRWSCQNRKGRFWGLL